MARWSQKMANAVLKLPLTWQLQELQLQTAAVNAGHLSRWTSES